MEKKLPSIILSLLLCTQCFTQKPSLSSAKQGQALIDSLTAELARSTSDTGVIKLYSELSYSFPYINPDEGLRFGKMGLELAEKISWQKGIASTCASIGANYATKSDYAKALTYEYRALKIYEQLNDKAKQAMMLRNIGIVHHNSRNQEQALEYDLKSLAMYEELNDKKGIAAIYGNMANVYYTLKDKEKVIEFNLKALEIYKELNDQQGTARLLGNIANVYAIEGDFSLAMIYYFDALRKETALGNKNGITRNLGNIGETYLDISKQNEVEIKSDSLIPNSKKANLNKAVEYLSIAVANAKELKQTEYFLAFGEVLSDAYMLSGNTEEAFHIYKDYIIVRDSIYDVEKYNEATRMELNYEYGKREDSISFQKQLTDVKLAEEKKSREREQVFYFGGIILLLAVAFIIYRNYLKQRSLNNLLAEANNNLKATQHQLVQSEKMAAIGAVASRLAHEIQNPLNFVNNFSSVSEELMSEIINSENEEEKKLSSDLVMSNLKIINQHGKRASDIVKQLQDYSNKGIAHEFFAENV